jgi:hypothetical protein
MHRRRTWTSTAVIVACSTLFLVRTAAAGEYTYSLSYSAEDSDNVGLSATNQKSELTHVLDSNFVFSQIDRNLDARASARAAYRAYQHNTFADEATFGLDSALVWKPLPEVFQWAVNEIFTQVMANPTQADTPANRVNTNVFSTGPDVFWRLDPVNTVQLSARYVSNTFSGTNNAVLTTDADNTRGNGTIKWSYRYSPVTTFSLGHATESVRFKDPGVGTNLDFRTQETTVGLANRRSRNTFTIELGETRIDRSGQPEISGGSGRLSWARELASDSVFSLSAARSLSDTAGEILVGSGATAPIGAPLAVNTSDIFAARTYTLEYSRSIGGGNLGVSAFRAERTFKLATNDNDDARGGNIQYSRIFSERVTGTVLVGFVRTLFPTIVREDRNKTAAASLQYRFTRRLVGGLSVARQSQSSTDPSADFDENRIALSLVYNSLPIRW